MRIIEHRNQINWNTSNKSVITKHRLCFKHDFDCEDVEIVEIIDRERYLGK